MTVRSSRIALFAVAALLGVVLLWGGTSRPAVAAQPPSPSSAPSPTTPMAMPAFGLGLSLPLITFPPATLTTALTLINLHAEAPLTLDMAARLGLRLYLGALGFRAGLTSTEGSLLIFLTPGMARFYVGGGVGVFPYEAFTPPIPAPPTYGLGGLLFSLHHLAGIRVITGILSIFAELKYEVMPQPICLIDNNLDGTYDEVCDGFGAVSSLQIAVGVMVNFGAGMMPWWCYPCPPQE